MPTHALLGVTLETLQAQTHLAHECLDLAWKLCLEIREADGLLAGQQAAELNRKMSALLTSIKGIDQEPASKGIDQGATSGLFRQRTMPLLLDLMGRCCHCRSSQGALQIIRLANANCDREPIPIPIDFSTSLPALTAHEAACSFAWEVRSLNNMSAFDYDWEAEYEEGKPYPESGRIRDCRLVAQRVERVTGAFIDDIALRIEQESIKAQRWLIDQGGAAAGGAEAGQDAMAAIPASPSSLAELLGWIQAARDLLRGQEDQALGEIGRLVRKGFLEHLERLCPVEWPGWHLTLKPQQFETVGELVAMMAWVQNQIAAGMAEAAEQRKRGPLGFAPPHTG